METSVSAESVSLVRTYPDLAQELSQMIASARKEIYLAPRFYEPSIGSRVLTKYAEGISLHVLDSSSCGTSFEKRLRLVSVHDTKNRDLILKMLDTPGLIIGVERLDYSFVVVDGKKCGVELVNPANPDNFTCALKIESEELAKELVGIFESFSKSASRTKALAPQTAMQTGVGDR